MSAVVQCVIWHCAQLSVRQLIDTYQMHCVTYHQRYVNQQDRHLDFWYVCEIYYLILYSTINLPNKPSRLCVPDDNMVVYH